MYRFWVLIFIPWPRSPTFEGDGGRSPSVSKLEPDVRGRKRTRDTREREREREKREPVFVQIWLMSAYTTFYLRHTPWQRDLLWVVPHVYVRASG